MHASGEKSRFNRSRGGALAAIGILAALTVAHTASGTGELAEQLELLGIVRDFQPTHPDFDPPPSEGFGHHMWNIETTLAPDGRPVYKGGGSKVKAQAEDVFGRPICWTLFDAKLGDTPAVAGVPDDGAVTSKGSFYEWFHDVPGVNLSTYRSVSGPLRDEGPYAGMYEINLPSFYPVDGYLLGNDDDHNNFFTVEIVAKFTADASKDYRFLFKSEDDVWVFIDGKMVADLGGLNGSPEQWVHVNRLGLVDGVEYPVHIFTTNRKGNTRFHLVTDVPLASAIEGRTVLDPVD